MSVDSLAEYLKDQLTHDVATDIWAVQLKDANYEDENVREEFEKILHDTDSFASIFDDVGKLAYKALDAGVSDAWKTLIDSDVEIDRVNGLFWVFIDKALSKKSNTRDIEYGFAASCAWLKLSALDGSILFKFFNQFVYKMVLSVFRLIYRLKMYGSRNATTMKKDKKGGKGGKKGAKKSAPIRVEPEDEEENPIDFNATELDDMLEKLCEALYPFLKTVPLSTCPDRAKETVDLVRDLIRLDIYKDTDTSPALSMRDMSNRDRVSDRAFTLIHLLCESRHSNGGNIVHGNFCMPRLLFFSWEGEMVPTSQTLPVPMTIARDVIVSFLKNRIMHTTDEDELLNIAKLVPNVMSRCPERAEYRHRVAQSVLDVLTLLPTKMSHDQLQLMCTFGLNKKAGLRALLIEMAPTILKDMDLDEKIEENDDEEREKSRLEKTKRKESGEEEEEDEEKDKRDKKKKKQKEKNEDEEEEEEEEMNTTRRKKKKNKHSDEEDEDDLNTTKRKARKEKKNKSRIVEDDDEDDDDLNTTKRKARKGKKNKNKSRMEDEDDEDEDENEDEGNTTKRRKRAAKDQSMIRMKQQKKRAERDSDEEGSEEERERRKKKKQVEAAKKKAQKTARVVLRPFILMLTVRGCVDKAGTIRARSLQQLCLMVNEGMGDQLKEAADTLVKEHPRIIVQAMATMDEEKEGEEEEDEEAKARAAKLAELAAAELEIKNGLLYIVKSRLEDDVAAVRKAAILAFHSLFFEWHLSEEEAEDAANALKLRCLDTSQTVRKQAMDALSSLLHSSLEKGHRRLLETTWLKSVLPLINDREDSVQILAAKMVEEKLINPIMLSSTPDACWHMMERVEEEVSNRRLLVRTLAFLSTKDTRTLKDTIVTTLYKKLLTDPDHSNVIWMLLADLSTVFGDKIDPRTAVQTWYNLAENETANMMSYVAKVVGEGAKKLNDTERDRVSQDIEDKLFAFKIHGPHIATVYLTVARLMDAVGEQATGSDVLERFGLRLLEEASRIIYSELEMFTEMEEDKQEVAKEDEIRVIRIVITIGEIIQLTPSLIDHTRKLFDGLQLIMSSELYLSEEFQRRKWMNSAVPSVPNSRAPSAMSEQPSTQGSAAPTLSQPTVIPSQVDHDARRCSLRKALFTASIRRCALTTIGKFCLMDEQIAKDCIVTFVKQLKLNPDHIIRNNIVIVLCDLCIRYTLLVDKYTPIIASCLTDRSILVRQQTLECLTILIKEAFIRWEGQLMYRFVATILDECRPIREYAMFCLKDILLPQNPSMFFNHFIECILYFNDVPRKYKMVDPTEEFLDKRNKFTLSGKANEASRIKLYEFMLDTFTDKEKFLTMAKMCEEIFSAVYTEEMSIENENVVALLTDAFKVIACEQMQLKLDVGRKGEEDEDEPAPQVLQDAAKSMITEVFRAAIITNIMPHVLELRRYLVERRHPIMKYMLAVLRALTRSHMDQLTEFFSGDKLALREIEFDIKRLNNLENKLKLKAAEDAQLEKERALSEARKSTIPGGGEGKEKEGEKKRKEKGESEKEVPIHPNQVVTMDGMEDDEVFHPQERAETSTKENGESVDVEMEEAATTHGGEEKKDEEMEKETEDGTKEGEEEKGEEGGEKEKEGGEMEVEGENGGGDEDGTEGGEKDDEVIERGEDEEEEGSVDREKEDDGQKKNGAERGEAEVKEEPMEEGENPKKEKGRRRSKRVEEIEKRKEGNPDEVVIKEEPLDEGEDRENQFAVPSMIGGRKRTRAPSEMLWMNESAMIGGYGQSTPRKGTLQGENEDGTDDATSPPRLDLDISAIGPHPGVAARPVGRPPKSRASRKPTTGTIEE